MTEIRITRKDLFQWIGAYFDGMEMDTPEAENIRTQVVDMCGKYVAQLSKPRKPRANTAAVEFARNVANLMQNFADPMTNKELVAAYNEAYPVNEDEAKPVSSQKMSAALRRLVADGVVTRTEGEKKSDAPMFVLSNYSVTE